MAVKELVSLITGRKTTGQIDNLVLDVTIREEHSYTNEITQHPIESGSDINDHVIIRPETLTLEGFVTNSPIQWLGGLRNLQSGITAGTRVERAHEALLLFARRRYLSEKRDTGLLPEFQPIDIETGLRIYTNMVLTDLSIPRDKDTGEALYFTATFVKVRFVESSTATAQNINSLNEVDGSSTQAAGEESGGIEKAGPLKSEAKELELFEKGKYQKGGQKLLKIIRPIN